MSRLLIVLQAEALLGVGAAVAANPHEAMAAINGREGSKALLTEALVAVLALDDAPDGGDLCLPWARAECALALLQECLPVVQATHHVEGLRQAQALSRGAARGGGGGGFPWISSSSSSGGDRASMAAEDRGDPSSSSSSLTVQEMGAVLLEGLVRGVARIEQQQQQEGRSQGQEARYGMKY